MDRLRNPKGATQDQPLLPLLTTTQTRRTRAVVDAVDEAEATRSIKEGTVHQSQTMATLVNPLTLLRVSRHLLEKEEEEVAVEVGTRADTRPEEEEEAMALFQEEVM